MKNERHWIESRIHDFCSENGLKEGAALPSAEVLGRMWGFSSEDVAEAMEAAQHSGWIRRQADGSAVLLSTLIHHEADEFSFTRSAHLLGEEVRAEVIAKEMVVRLPLTDNPLQQIEKEAYEALGLKKPEPFIVIPRIRYLGGKPRALHRVYLDPRRFKPTFLSDHDFAKESLVHIYESYGYTLTSRDTTLTARLPNLLETQDLALENAPYTPVLVAEQQLFALDPATKTAFTLEFLQGTYLHWKYRIEDRPPPRTSQQAKTP
ncbi:MAG TPA: GntR family transcriptional regulator [Candidatus Accumulibacter phosphatis]|nr:GntR family transcriptional regulator [Candidatus Accumulibacter phosphatis]